MSQRRRAHLSPSARGCHVAARGCGAVPCCNSRRPMETLRVLRWRAVAVALVAQLAMHIACAASDGVTLISHERAWVSSNEAHGYKATDGDSSTFWQSGSCGNWYSRQSRLDNAVRDACREGHCSSSCAVAASPAFSVAGSSALERATDGNAAYTAATVRPCAATGRVWLTIQLPTPTSLYRVYVRGSFPAPNGTLVQATLASGETIMLGTLTPADQWQPRVFDLPAAVRQQALTTEHEGSRDYNTTVMALHLRAYSDGVRRGYCYGGTGECMAMTVTEVAAQPRPCVETATIDSGRVVAATHVRMRVTGHESFTNASLLRSFDGLRWSVVVPQLAAVGPQWDATTRLWAGGAAASSVVLGRWWQVRFAMKPDPVFSTVKVTLWEFAMATTHHVGEPYGTLASPDAAPTGWLQHHPQCFNDTAMHGLPCSGAGACVNSTCQCLPGYYGVSCNVTTCAIRRTELGHPAAHGDGCGEHGTCDSQGECVCEPWYSGAFCDTVVCPRGCGGRGVCTGPGVCQCQSGYSGTSVCLAMCAVCVGCSCCTFLFLPRRGLPHSRFVP